MTNPLREAIEDFGVYMANQYGGFEGYDKVDEQEIDRVIDAVIGSLPALKQEEYVKKNGIGSGENKDRFYRYGGYDFAINEIKRILESAKGSK